MKNGDYRLSAGKVVRVDYLRLRAKCNHRQQTFEKLETSEAKFNENRQNLDLDSKNG